jgi:hypothetical protein
MSTYGLIGTVTSDHVIRDEGPLHIGLGGILYQAAVLCGLGENVRLYANCGLERKEDVEKLSGHWPTLGTAGLRYVPGPGNQVFLRYSERLKERDEVLQSVVPPLDPDRILADLTRLDMLLMVFNSGFDLEFEDWRKIAGTAKRPIWFDVHSLVLDRKLGVHRNYVALPDWREWMAGVTFFQANRQELACLLGHPGYWAEEKEIASFASDAFRLGIQAVFVTMGGDGILVSAPNDARLIRSPKAERVVDTTGCGDVFCAKTAQCLARGIPLFEAAEAGAALASQAAGSAGVGATYTLAQRRRGQIST